MARQEEPFSMVDTRFRLLVVLTLVPWACSLFAAEPAAKDNGRISYYKTIRPIFQQHCQGCHQPAKSQGGYIMTSHAQLLKAGDSEHLGVVPGQADKSELVKQLLPRDGKPPAMPKGKEPLPERDIKLIQN